MVHLFVVYNYECLMVILRSWISLNGCCLLFYLTQGLSRLVGRDVCLLYLHALTPAVDCMLDQLCECDRIVLPETVHLHETVSQQ